MQEERQQSAQWEYRKFASGQQIGSRSRWIVATRKQRVAPANPPSAFHAADDWPVFLHTQNEVFATTGRESTHGR